MSTPKQFGKELYKCAEKMDVDNMRDEMQDIIDSLDIKIEAMEEKNKLTDKQQEKLDELKKKRDYFEFTISEILDNLETTRDSFYDAASEIEEWE